MRIILGIIRAPSITETMNARRLFSIQYNIVS